MSKSASGSAAVRTSAYGRMNSPSVVVVVRGRGLDRPVGEAVGLRVRVRVEGSFGAAARPEPAAVHLVAVRQLLDPVGAVRHAARVPRRGPAREARRREVGPTPEEVDGARLADEAGAERAHHPIRLEKCLPEPSHRARVVGVVILVLREGDRRPRLPGAGGRSTPRRRARRAPASSRRRSRRPCGARAEPRVPRRRRCGGATPDPGSRTRSPGRGPRVHQSRSSIRVQRRRA